MTDRYVSIDPGNKESGFVVFTPHPGHPGGLLVRKIGIMENKALRAYLADIPRGERRMLAVEMLRARGMPTANEELQTCVEIGRMLQTWGPNWTYVFRLDVKIHICGSVKATDANIRQALIDTFGGQAQAIGGKKCAKCHGKTWVGRNHDACDRCRLHPGWEHPPGPLYDARDDAWSALAIAVYWAATKVQCQGLNPSLPKKRKKKPATSTPHPAPGWKAPESEDD